ncbi:MAG: alpha/beta hydrolase [Alphaproteobacteria bacterium]|nr:alpha/beta hydrolase [Alphaproteobacteria bacterium]
MKRTALTLAALLSTGCGAVLQHTVPLPPTLAVEPGWSPAAPRTLESGVRAQDLDFPCGEARCAGTLFLPAEAEVPPLVLVMAHGFTGERDMSLPAYAERFAEAGFAAFTFDYRHWGDSGGLPRYEIVAEEQVEDYLSAIGFLRGRSELKGAGVVAWGTSFSGGHALIAAHRDGQLAGVISQVPMVNGLAEPEGQAHEGALVWPLVRLSFKDKWREIGDKERLYVPAFPDPGEVGFLIGEEAYEARGTLIPEGSDWPNLVAPAILIDFDEYHPNRVADEVTAPTLFVIGEGDTYVSNAATEKVAAAMPNAHVSSVDAGHFGVYAGPAFEEVVSLELGFLRTLMGVQGTTTVDRQSDASLTSTAP